MKVFLDTSVLVASVIEKHEAHTRAFAVLTRVQTAKDEGFIAAHSLLEMYATLTRLPVPFRHSPEQALMSIQENVIKHFEISGLAVDNYVTLVQEAAFAGIQGGTVYDAQILKCAGKSKPDRIYTLNLRHFQAIATTELSALLAAP
jgi:predicted nucleic acid-binding protein